MGPCDVTYKDGQGHRGTILNRLHGHAGTGRDIKKPVSIHRDIQGHTGIHWVYTKQLLLLQGLSVCFGCMKCRKCNEQWTACEKTPHAGDTESLDVSK